MNLPDYSYQDNLIKRVLSKFEEGHKEVVLAAGCCSGKTRMSIKLSEILVKENPKTKILVLAHGQSILKTQYFNELLAYGPKFSFGTINSKTDSLKLQISVGIPQSIGDQVTNADVIICDEAHQFYLAKMVQDIIKRNKPRKILLLTGSPSKFIAKNYEIIPFSVSELLDHGVISDPRVSLLKSTYGYGKDDLNEDHEINTSYKLRKKNTEETLDIIKKRITGKTLIACRNNEHAKDVFTFLQGKYSCLLSTSSNDRESENITKFINGNEQILVVVYRSILGFSLNELETVIDISGSHNPDRIFQLMSRTIRKSSKQKYFYKVTTDLLADYTFSVMSLVVALTQPEVYTTYAGNINNVTFPLPKGIISSRDGGHGNEYSYKVFDYQFDSFHQIRNKNEYAWTTIAEVKKLLYGKALTANPMMTLLFQMAERGEDRPRQRSKIGKYLCIKTHPSNRGFDPEFNKKIRENAPSWFESPKERFMREIFKIANTKGSVRPGQRNHALGEKLQYWLWKDHEFKKKIHELRPDWFADWRSINSKESKTKLIKMAKRLRVRPTKRSSTLMSKFFDYTRPKSDSYDPDFVKKIKEINPNWLS
jgi:hypothetical protein